MSDTICCARSLSPMFLGVPPALRPNDIERKQYQRAFVASAVSTDPPAPTKRTDGDSDGRASVRRGSPAQKGPCANSACRGGRGTSQPHTTGRQSCARSCLPMLTGFCSARTDREIIETGHYSALLN